MSHSNLPAHISAPRPISQAMQVVEPPSASSLVQAEPALSLLEIIMRHKGKLMACVILALAAGVAFQVYAPKVYQSTAEVFIENTSDNQPRSALSASTGVVAGQPSTHASLLQSTTVLQAALRHPTVAESPTFANFESDALRMRHLRKKLAVQFSKESEIVTVSFRSHSPVDAAATVNAIIDAYLQRLGLDTVADQAAAANSDEVVPSGITEMMLEANLMQLSQDQTAAVGVLRSSEMLLEQGKNASGDLAKIASLVDASGMNSRDYGLAEIAYLKAELARLDQRIEGMPESWGPSHKIRGPVQRQADALRFEIQTLRSNAEQTLLGLLKGHRDNAAERVAELDKQIQVMQAQASLMAKSPVDLVEYAEVPNRKVAPKGVQTMGVALFLGLSMGVVLALLSEMKADARKAAQAVAVAQTQAQAQAKADETLPMLMRSDDVSETLTEQSPPLLGQVPEVPSGNRLTSPNFDATASSIHQIRAVLQIQARSKNARAFAFTSPRRGAGKTSVTIGVASSLAMSGTRTLVVDCDLAGRIARGQTGMSHAPSPASRDRFGPIDPHGSSPANASLDNILVEQGYVDEEHSAELVASPEGKGLGVTGMLDGRRLEECLVEATVPGLSLLPAVNAQTHHIGQMSDAFIRRLIQEAQPHFDLVLFDSGPIPGSVEALLVTSQADGVVVVIPQGETRQALSRTMSYLKMVDANVTGTVFNRATDSGYPASPDQPTDAGAVGAAKVAAVAAAGSGSIFRDVDDDEDTPSANPPKPASNGKAQQVPDDSEFAQGDAILGSGILAAAVFSDADSAYSSDNWNLEETSEFEGSVDGIFGEMNGKSEQDKPRTNGQA